jgi:hypothetical protein
MQFAEQYNEAPLSHAWDNGTPWRDISASFAAERERVNPKPRKEVEAEEIPAYHEHASEKLAGLKEEREPEPADEIVYTRGARHNPGLSRFVEVTEVHPSAVIRSINRQIQIHQEGIENAFETMELIAG